MLLFNKRTKRRDYCALFCCEALSVRKWLEHERSVGGNTKRSQVLKNWTSSFRVFIRYKDTYYCQISCIVLLVLQT